MGYLNLSQCTDPRVTVYADRADYILRNGGNPTLSQPPRFDATKPKCVWSAPAGLYTIPRLGAPNNLAVINETTPVLPNLPGKYNYPAPAAPAATSMTVAPVQLPAGVAWTPQPVDPRLLTSSALALALAARIKAATGVSLDLVEAQPTALTLTLGTTTVTLQQQWNYNGETRRVWLLVNKAKNTPHNAAALIETEQAMGVGYPGAWKVTDANQDVQWLAGTDDDEPVQGKTPPDLDIPVTLSPTQSVVPYPSPVATGKLVVLDSSTATPGSGAGSGDPAQLDRIEAKVNAIAKALNA